MKTEKDIKKRLREESQGRTETHKRFLKYDNIDDMHALEEYDAIIKTLEWVLR